MRRPTSIIDRVRDLALKVDTIAKAQGQTQSALNEIHAALEAQNAELETLRSTVAHGVEPDKLDAAILRGTIDTTRRLTAFVEKHLKHTFRQIEASQNLNAILPTDDVMPASRGWAASPDLLLTLVDQLITARPSLVLEAGSGASTLWMALTMRKYGIDGKVIALDHEPAYAAKTRQFLDRHGVADLAEVRDAPLEDFGIGEDTYAWYAKAAWEHLSEIRLVFIDGPPADTGDLARFPALPLLHDALAPDAVLVLDDLIVPDMQETLQRWLGAYPEFTSEALPLEKQAAILRRK